MLEPDAPGTARRVLLVVILGTLSMLAPLGIDLYLPAMPAMAEGLGAAPGTVQLTLSGFMLGFALGQLVHGPLADSLGRRRVLMAGTLGYGVFSVLCALAPGAWSLVGLRVLQGACGAAGSTVVFALLRDVYDRKEDLSRMVSFVGLVMMLAPLVAPLLGGWLLLWAGWRAAFWTLALVALASLLLAWGALPETLPAEGRPPLRLGRAVRNYVSLLGRGRLMGYLLPGALPAGGMFAFITAGPFVYIELHGVSPQHFGYYFGLNILAMSSLTYLNSRLVHRVGVRRVLRAGLGLNCLAGLWLAAATLLDLGFWPLVVGVMAFIGTIAAIGANALAMVMEDYRHMAGTVSSLAGMIRFGTGALVGALVAVLPVRSAAPMALTMTTCALAAVAVHVLLARPPEEGGAPEEGRPPEVRAD